MNLAYRLPNIRDEKILRDYIEEHYICGEYSLTASMGLASMPFCDWVEQIQKNADLGNGDWGRSHTLLCFDGENLIGLLSIRYELSEEMRQKYGDIGYGVRPKERKKGYATEMLRHALDVCREKSMKEAVLGCYQDNTASVKVILKNNGRLIRECEGYKKGKVSKYFSIAL